MRGFPVGEPPEICADGGVEVRVGVDAAGREFARVPALDGVLRQVQVEHQVRPCGDGGAAQQPGRGGQEAGTGLALKGVGVGEQGVHAAVLQDDIAPVRHLRQPPGLDKQELAQRLLAFGYRACFLARQEPAAAGVVGVAGHEGNGQIAQVPGPAGGPGWSCPRSMGLPAPRSAAGRHAPAPVRFSRRRTRRRAAVPTPGCRPRRAPRRPAGRSRNAGQPGAGRPWCAEPGFGQHDLRGADGRVTARCHPYSGLPAAIRTQTRAGTIRQPTHSAADPNAETAIIFAVPAGARRWVLQVAGEPGRAEKPAGRLLSTWAVTVAGTSAVSRLGTGTIGRAREQG